MSDQTQSFSSPDQKYDLESSIEALLFVAASSVSIAQLAAVLEETSEVIEQALRELEKRYLNRGGIRIQWSAGRVQLTTAPEYAPTIEKFLGYEATTHLSRAAQETLAIIAYRQPITRPGIDAIRGVNSDGVLRSLLSKGLIQEVGRAEGPGRPILYGTTAEFLQYFGLSSLSQLPPYEVGEVGLGEENNQLLKD
ncbi:MAG: SMC-Scp complex subunit ScpB [Anaerolineales bacterium]